MNRSSSLATLIRIALIGTTALLSCFAMSERELHAQTEVSTESFEKWFVRWESIPAFAVAEECTIQSEMMAPLNRVYSHTGYWRSGESERIVWLRYQKRPVAGANNPNQFQAILDDVVFDGRRTLERSITNPLEPRRGTVEAQTGIMSTLFDAQVQRNASINRPIWLLPQRAPFQSSCRSIHDYLGKASLFSSEGEQELSGATCETYVLNFDDDNQQPGNGTTEVVHRWWLGPERGSAPLQWQWSYKIEGQPIRFTATVKTWIDTDDIAFSFPATYELIEEQGITADKWVVASRRSFEVTKCERNSELPEDFFSTAPMRGVMYRHWSAEGDDVGIEIVDQEGKTVVVYSELNRPSVSEREAIRAFQQQNAANRRFTFDYQPLPSLPDWPATVQGARAR